MKQSAPYRTLVVRCWQEPYDQSGSCVYRFSLEIPATGERFGFTHSEDLVHALELTLTQLQTQAIADQAAREKPN